jgi:phage terminase small subunit
VEIISRTKAEAAGLVRFFTSKPCPRGHISERLVSNRQCITCGRIKNRQRDKKRLKRPATPPTSRTPGTPLKDPRQEAFCQGVAKGLHKYEAYQQAGYKGGRVAAKNFPHSKRPNVRKHIQDRIDELIAEAAGKAQITIDKVVSELGLIAFANMQDYLDENGQPLTLQQLTRDEAAAIKDLTVTESFDDKTGKLTRTHYRCKLQDKRAALVDLGKHLGLFRPDCSIDVVNNNVDVNVSRKSGEEALQKILGPFMQDVRAREAAEATEVEQPMDKLPIVVSGGDDTAPPPPNSSLRLVYGELVQPSDVSATVPSDLNAPEARSTTQQFYDWMARNLDKSL